jgi:hypothetical protein
MIYHCPWDTKVLTITVLTTIVVVAVAICLSFKAKYYRKERETWSAFGYLASTLFCLGLLIFMAWDCPSRVSVEKEAITIHLVNRDIVIPLDEIEEIRLYHASGTYNLRIFGSGGAFGYLGKFNNVELGDYQMYVTDSSRKILVKTADKTLVFSCDNPDELVDYVHSSRIAPISPSKTATQ